MSALAVHLVDTPAKEPSRPNRLIAVAVGCAPKVIEAGYRAVAVPLISLLLIEYCQLGPVIDTESEYGQQVSATLEVLYRGKKLAVRGAIVPLVGSPYDLILPGAVFD